MKKLIIASLTSLIVLTTSCQTTEPINSKIDSVKIGSKKEEIIKNLGDYRRIQYLDADTTVITYFLTKGFLKDGVRLDYKLKNNVVTEINYSEDIEEPRY
jgi:hypothetical protein